MLGRAEDAGAEVRGRAQHPQLREPRPPAEVPAPVHGRGIDEVHQVPAGFALELFAAEPDIVKPISIAWDERGRLWVAVRPSTTPTTCAAARPGRRPDQIVCEDTDGDGKADKFTVFADKLSIPTSLTFANGGVIVHEAPHTLFLKDTDGDGKADVRKVLFTGWGTRDTHAGPSNLRYGLDNWICGMVGYSGFRGTVGGESLHFAQGFYRFKPDGCGLEFLRSTNNNSWGVGFSEDGRRLRLDRQRLPERLPADPQPLLRGSVGCRAAPGSGPRYQRARRHVQRRPPDKVRQVDWHGGFTAAAGHALYTARATRRSTGTAPRSSAEPTGHLVGHVVLEPQGTDFASRNGWNLLARSTSGSPRSRAGRPGRRGVGDRLVQLHRPAQPHAEGLPNGQGNAYETPLRDKTHGRISASSTDGRSATLALGDDATPDLLEALASDNMFWRLHRAAPARRARQEGRRAAAVELVRDTPVDAIGTNGGAFHALWTLQGLGETANASSEGYRVAVEALKHPAAGVRKAAAMVLPKTPEAANAIVGAGLLDDPDLHTRLAAVLAIAEMPGSPEIGKALYADARRRISAIAG